MDATNLVLITGAMGTIGTYIAPRLAGQYTLRLTDIRVPQNAVHDSFRQADIADFETIRAVTEGVTTIIHLAADASPNADWSSLFRNNLLGTYNILQAASERKCRRVIFASSLHAADGQMARVNVQAKSFPSCPYGASKLWGEYMTQLYSEQYGLSGICLRLGWVKERQSPHIRPRQRALDRTLTHEDLLRLIVAAIEAPSSLRFGVFYGLSDNRWKRFSIAATRTALGYQPQDDAFALAGRTSWIWKLGRQALGRGS